MIDTELDQQIEYAFKNLPVLQDDDIKERYIKLKNTLKDNKSMSVNRQEHYKRLKHLEGYLVKKGVCILNPISYSEFVTNKITP